jgi:hypothetical protein
MFSIVKLLSQIFTKASIRKISYVYLMRVFKISGVKLLERNLF